MCSLKTKDEFVLIKMVINTKIVYSYQLKIDMIRKSDAILLFLTNLQYL